MRSQEEADDQQTAEVLEQLAPLIPAENLQKAELILAQISQTTTRHSGPLPPARELADYKAIDESFAERIMQMAEREQAARHAIPNDLMKREYSLKSRGQHTRWRLPSSSCSSPDTWPILATPPWLARSR